jgi:hypothetical protein
MNIFATSSGQARRAAGSARVAVPAAAAIAALALTGCSARSLAATGASAAKAVKAVKTVTVPPSTSPASTPAAPASTPPAASPPATTPTATASPSAPPAPPQPGALTATITILDPATGLVPGGPPVRFLVTVTNHASQPYSNIVPLVSLGHCTCTPSSLFPKGSLQERESTSNVWQAIPYDVEGFGTDYLSATDPGGIQMISPGATATFEYRVALSPATSAQVTRGTGALDVTLVRLPGHHPVGQAPSASALVDVQSGPPPA